MAGMPVYSISSSFQYDIPIEEQIPLVARTGFTHISLGVRSEHSGYLDERRRASLKARLSEHGLSVDTVHARSLNEPNAVVQAMETAFAASDLGASCVVAHAGPFHCRQKEANERIGHVISTCNALIPAAQDIGMIFALENVMPGPATDLVRNALHDLDPRIFRLCYDSSHDQIDGPRSFELIDEFSDRISAVHLSDRIKAHADHVIPGEGFIKWSEMCAKLRSAQYNGPVLMEVMMMHSRYQDPHVFLREAHRAAIETWNLIHNNAIQNRKAVATQP